MRYSGKVTISALLLFFVLVSVCSCIPLFVTQSVHAEQDDGNIRPSLMRVTDDGTLTESFIMNCEYVVDENTGVVYFMKSVTNGSFMSPVYNADGTVMTYDQLLELYGKDAQ